MCQQSVAHTCLAQELKSVDHRVADVAVLQYDSKAVSSIYDLLREHAASSLWLADVAVHGCMFDVSVQDPRVQGLVLVDPVDNSSFGPQGVGEHPSTFSTDLH